MLFSPRHRFGRYLQAHAGLLPAGCVRSLRRGHPRAARPLPACPGVDKEHVFIESTQQQQHDLSTTEYCTMFIVEKNASLSNSSAERGAMDKALDYGWV